MVLDGATLMKSALGRQVRFMCFMGRFKVADLTPLASDVDAGTPGLVLLVIAVHAKQSAICVAPGRAQILLVQTSIGFSQIAHTVVRPVAVDVVDPFGGPMSGHMEPRKPVRLVSSPINGNEGVPSRLMKAASNLSDLRSI